MLDATIAPQHGRPRWYVESMRERLRVLGDELPPRPEEPPDSSPIRRTVYLATPPVPSTFKDALSEACDRFDAVIAGTWQWPEPGAQDGWASVWWREAAEAQPKMAKPTIQ